MAGPKGGVQLPDASLGVQIYYDQPPHTLLTRVQLARTYCYDLGRPVSTLRPPLTDGLSYDSRKYTTSTQVSEVDTRIPSAGNWNH